MQSVALQNEAELQDRKKLGKMCAVWVFMPIGSFVHIKVLSDLKVVSWCFQCANVIVTARLSDLDLRSRILLQYERALLEVTLAGDWAVFRPSVWQAVDQVGERTLCQQ